MSASRQAPLPSRRPPADPATAAEAEGEGEEGESVRILLAEDVVLVAEALEALLSTEPGLEVVGRVHRGDEIVPVAARLQPDVAVLDVDLPGRDGISAARELHAAAPGCRVLLLTGLPGTGHVHRALAAGAAGYLRKDVTAARLIEAVRVVAGGGTIMDAQLAADALRAGPSPLSPREADVLRLLAQGLDAESVARTLHLTHGTVRNYVSSALSKTGTSHRSAAVREAQDRGWI